MTQSEMLKDEEEMAERCSYSCNRGNFFSKLIENTNNQGKIIITLDTYGKTYKRCSYTELENSLVALQSHL